MLYYTRAMKHYYLDVDEEQAELLRDILAATIALAEEQENAGNSSHNTLRVTRLFNAAGRAELSLCCHTAPAN